MTRDPSIAGLGVCQETDMMRRIGGERTAHRRADLIDLDHGAWQGLTVEEARERDPEEFDRFRRSPDTSTPPGGEALKDVERRTAEALRRLSLLHEGAPIAAVSHEIPIRLVLCRAAPLPPPWTMWDLELPTGSVTELLVLESDLRLASQDAAPLHE
jgi:broad specificity phosphatase PhoE